MSLQDDVELLRKVPLFANVEPSKLKLLAFASERLSFDSGHVLFRQGEQGDAAYVIIDGAAEVVADTPEGPVPVAELGQNAFVGEIAILRGVPRTATVVAKGPLTALKITKDLFIRMVTEFPQIGVEVMRVLAERLDRTTADLIAERAARKSKT